MPIPKYYNNEDDFEQIHQDLKQYMCPFCHLIGFLILHGYLKGYDETGVSQNHRRGHRIFCSNRKKRSGCGKTFSILLANILKGFIITAETLWKFIRGLLKGSRLAEVLKDVSHFTKSTGYRLKRLLYVNQTSIRTKLCSISNPLDNEINNPTLLKRQLGLNRMLSTTLFKTTIGAQLMLSTVHQTIQHLNYAFTTSSQQSLCPVSAFQLKFQSSFFEHPLPKSGCI